MPQTPPLDERAAACARRRLRAEAAPDVPDSWAGFLPEVAEGFRAAGVPLDAARLWRYLYESTPGGTRAYGEGSEPRTLDAALLGGHLLGLDADAVGQALQALLASGYLVGTPEAFGLANPGVPF